MLKNENIPERIRANEARIIEKRKLYRKPYLEEMGDLRTVTLGPSLGPYEPSPGDMTHHEPLQGG
jgi:hypothetical protein